MTQLFGRTFFAGGSMDAADADRVVLDPETGAPRLQNEESEKRRRALITLYYRRGNQLCLDWPPKSADYALGEQLRNTASRLQAFPKSFYLRSLDAWAWGLMGFVAGPDWD